MPVPALHLQVENVGDWHLKFPIKSLRFQELEGCSHELAVIITQMWVFSYSGLLAVLWIIKSLTKVEFLRFSSALDLGVSTITNNMTVDGSNNEVEVPGRLLVGLTSALHKLTVLSTDNKTMRLIGPNTYGHGARLNFW